MCERKSLALLGLISIAVVADGCAAGGSSESQGPRGNGVAPGSTVCTDGVDNDGDGLVDWQFDLGCYGAADGTEGGLTTRSIDNGWSVFEPAADTRIIYVSSSDGSDDAEGLSPISAKETIAAGLALARDGQADWVLLKRGDKWTDENELELPNGRSQTEPFVLATYGSSAVRPIVETGAEGAIKNLTLSNAAIIGINFYAHGRDPGNPNFVGWDSIGRGLDIQGGGSNLLVEDNWFNFYTSNSIKGVSDLSVRRNVFTNNYDSTAHGQGLYSSGNTDVLLEGNYFDHNGWYNKQSTDGNDEAEGQATVFNHNIYFSSIDRATIRENIFWRPSSICVKMATTGGFKSDDVVIENNLLVDCEVGMSIGGNDVENTHRFVSYTIRDNVFTDMGITLPTNRTLAYYLDITDWDGGLVDNNLFLYQRQDGLGNSFGIRFSNLSNRNITVQNNLFYDIAVGRGVLDVLETDSNRQNINFENNDIQIVSFSSQLVEGDEGIGNIRFAGNNYFTNAAQSDWFRVGGADFSLGQWQGAADSVNETSGRTEFPEPRDLQAYQQSLGQSATIEAFMTAASLQSKHTWDVDYEASVVNDWIRAGFAR